MLTNRQQQAAPQKAEPAVNPAWPTRDRKVAAILAILLGGVGAHKFYLGKIGLGVLYILFSWTLIPEILGIIEGILYLCSSDETFQQANHVQVPW